MDGWISSGIRRSLHLNLSGTSQDKRQGQV